MMYGVHKIRATLLALSSKQDWELNVLGWRITDPRSDYRVHAGHIRNLIRLADGMAALPESHPSYDTLQGGGDGKGWWRWDGGGIVSYPDEDMPPVCDTASRALGHATLILGEKLLPDETWKEYQGRLFGPLSGDAEAYIFSCFWEEYGERHPHNAARRIADVLAYADNDEMNEVRRRTVGMARSS